MVYYIGASISKADLPAEGPKLSGNQIMRIFPTTSGDAKVPPAWSDSRFAYCEANGVIPFVSTKIYEPTTSTFDGIAAMTSLQTWLEDMPSWITGDPDMFVYLTNIHEPEGDEKPNGVTMTATEFKTYHNQILAMVNGLDPAIRAKVRFGAVLTRQWTENTSGRDYSTWDPTTGDFLGCDFYGNSWDKDDSSQATDEFIAPATMLNKWLSYKASDTDTRDRILPELGYIGAPFDTNGSARAAWMAGIDAILKTCNDTNPNWTMPWTAIGWIWWHQTGKPASTSKPVVEGIGYHRWFQLDRRHNGSYFDSADPTGGYATITNSAALAKFNELVSASIAGEPATPPDETGEVEGGGGDDPDTSGGTVAFTATPQPDNVPPRVLLSLTYTGQTEATVTRLDPDGRVRPVRLAEPATLTGGEWTGFDYESWFGVDTVYTATTAGGAIASAAISLDVGTAWLRHPGIPSLSQPVDFQGEGEPVRTVAQSVLEPIGRRTPVVVTDGVRRSKRAQITLRTKTAAEASALLDLLDDASVLLLDLPPSFNYGMTEHQYLALGDVTENRLRPDYYPHPWRIFTAPYIVVDRPAGGLQSERTYADILADWATYNDVLAAYATYNDLLTGIEV